MSTRELREVSLRLDTSNDVSVLLIEKIIEELGFKKNEGGRLEIVTCETNSILNRIAELIAVISPKDKIEWLADGYWGVIDNNDWYYY